MKAFLTVRESPRFSEQTRYRVDRPATSADLATSVGDARQYVERKRDREREALLARLPAVADLD